MMTSKKILVVDDEDRVLEMIEFRLSFLGYEVLLAADGEKAFETARQETPDLILLDVMMPDPDGFQVCSKLKQEDATRDIPVVMLTARADATYVTKAFDSGADDYIVKPYDPLVLQQKILDNLAAGEPA